ncbi:MAG TPA: GNAT family N-acetyltransferase [Trichocoleus sp.]
MQSDLEYAVLQDEQDAKRLSEILSQGFVGEVDAELQYLNRIGLNQIRTMRRASKLIGGLAMLPMGQWFGGRCVPMTGIASVSVAPEARGSGAALKLMQQTLQELHQQGVALSTLYPATQYLYRQVGYEQGGTFCQRSCSTVGLATVIRNKRPPLPIEPMPLNWQALLPLAQRQAGRHNGLLERHEAIWLRIVEPVSPHRHFAYCLGEPEAPEGYVIFSQTRTGSNAILKILDWVVLTPAAAQSLWAFLAMHQSQIDQVHWQSGAIDLLSLPLSEQLNRIESLSRWMTRIVCLEPALISRGYPLALEGELHLEVQDNLLPDNQGPWILSFDKGQGQVSKGGSGDLKLDVRGLAALYTGMFSPYQLQNMGLLEGSEAALSLAGQAFGGASPWLADFF